MKIESQAGTLKVRLLFTSRKELVVFSTRVSAVRDDVKSETFDDFLDVGSIEPAPLLPAVE